MGNYDIEVRLYARAAESELSRKGAKLAKGIEIL
jgi:hypothetical protein